jgi:hypothetical protein
MRSRIVISLIGLIAALGAGAVSIAGSTGAGASIWHPRPQAAQSKSIAVSGTGTTTSTVPYVDDQFQSGTGGWCLGGSSPCDGNAGAGNFGTIDAGIPGHFSNGGFGNYAPSAPALFKSKMALISGTTMANQGLGCQTPGTEGCTGPYYVPPSTEGTFPSTGFTVTDDIYLDVHASPGTAGEIDPDVALSKAGGAYGQDMVFAVCNQGGGTGYSVTFGHNSPGDCSGSPVITSSGWYRFVWIFTNVGGKVFLTQRAIAESGGAIVADSGPQPVVFPGDSSVEPVSAVGGVHYTWFPTLQVAGMPMGNFAIQQGQHDSGHTPG